MIQLDKSTNESSELKNQLDKAIKDSSLLQVQLHKTTMESCELSNQLDKSTKGEL